MLPQPIGGKADPSDRSALALRRRDILPGFTPTVSHITEDEPKINNLLQNRKISRPRRVALRTPFTF